MTNFEKELLQSAKEALAIAKGEMKAPRTYVPATVDVAAIRKKLGLSQARFAAKFGLSAATVRDWEQKRRNPDQIARTLLTIIDRNHEAVERALMG